MLRGCNKIILQPIYYMELKEKVCLADITTIKCGGDARYYAECNNENDLIEAIDFAKENHLKIQVLGGGSNIIFPDEGFDGLVIRYLNEKMSIENDNLIIAKGGAVWDELVEYSIKNKLQGLECLSGIPGLVGGAPIQNIGAYGTVVKNYIRYVECLDRISKKTVRFSNEECEFEYRMSAFKSKWKDRYIITEVCFELSKDKEPVILYPELKLRVDKNLEYATLKNKDKLQFIRNTIIQIRSAKSMVINSKDENTRSCGSFFTNPIIPEAEYNSLKHIGDIPAYKTAAGMKLSAAKLIELAGFHKGYRYKGVGISANHSLALINIDGNTHQLLELSSLIKQKVFAQFGIKLVEEPVIV